MLAQPDHVFKSGDTYVAAKVELGTLVLAETRNEDAVADGNFSRLITVIPLQEAIAIAKAVLATQQAEEDAAYDAWVEQQYQQYLDYQALVDSALCHEISF
jgi:6,7-dimethyl-8-ribityllumazine synthase